MKKKLILTGLIILTMTLGSVVMADDYLKKVKPLKWMGEKSPDTYDQYKKRKRIMPFYIESVPIEAKGKKDSMGKIIVMVQKELYGELSEYISRYLGHIVSGGYSSELYLVQGGVAEDLKKFLIDSGSSLRGCVMIGEFPIAWYEVENDYDEHGKAEFPCDLFFMDLDGNWKDSDNNGRYDEHSNGAGNMLPEIFIARIDTTGMAGNEVSLLKNFFDKNHKFWKGDVSFSNRGLTYTDDDWVDFTDITGGIVSLYPDTADRIKAPSTHRDDYYNRRLDNPVYYLTQLACHSGPETHYFERGGTLGYESVVNSSPGALVYNLFCCSALRYSNGKCLGKAYLYNEGKGLAVVGSTKTGSMLKFRYFYEKLGKGDSVGAAFLHWFRSIGDYDIWDVYWHYGMTILGDPMVFPDRKPDMSSSGVKAPAEFKGRRVLNRSLAIKEYINILEWKKPVEMDESEIEGFTIWFTVNNEEKLIKLIDTEASATGYMHRKTEGNNIYHYYIKTRDKQGNESISAEVTLQEYVD